MASSPNAPEGVHHSPERARKRYHKAPSTGRFARFFGQRGGLDLSRDSSGHRRYAWLYEDMLT